MATAGVFRQRGNTVRIGANTNVPPRAYQALSTSGSPSGYDYTFTNLGPSVAFVGIGQTEADAIANSAIPNEGGPGRYCVILAPGQRSYEGDSNSYFAARTINGTADIFITPGKGPSDGFTGDLGGVGAASVDEASENRFVALRDLMRDLLVELRAHTFYMREGFVVMDDPDTIRRDSDQALVK